MRTQIILGFMGLGMTELLVILVVALLLGLLPVIFYLLTLSNTIKLCAEHNRKISPGEVWLSLIPLFGTIWNFIMIGRIADTLAAECRQRNIPTQEARPGYNVGLAYAILGCCGWIPYLGSIAGIATLVCWIIYWVRIAGYKKMLENQQFTFGQGNPYQFPNQPNQPNQYNQPHQ